MTNSFDANAPAPERSAPANGDAPAPERRSRVGRIAPVMLILGALAAVIAVALGSGAVTLPGSGDAMASTQQAAAATQMAADQRWAAATCSAVIRWKNAVQRDLQGLTLSLGAIPRVKDAIGASTRMAGSIERLGLPPALEGGQSRAQLDQLSTEIQSRLRGIESAANSVAGGNLLAVETLLSDLRNAPSMEGQISGQLGEVASELGVSLASSSSCRQLVGLKL